MARIPVERNTGGGAWWWVLVIAVVGLVVWLVYEWFDNDYYEDYGYVDSDAGAQIDDPTGFSRDNERWGLGMGGAEGELGSDRVYQDGAADPYGSERSADVDTTQQDYLGDEDATGGVAGAAALTSLAPLTDDGWRQYVDRDVSLQDLSVSASEGDRAFMVESGGEDVLVVMQPSALPGEAVEQGQSVQIVDGTLRAIDDPSDLEQWGLDATDIQGEQFYILADRIQVTG